MNYKRVYDSIVARGKERVLDCYKENHHIVPRCLGGTDDSSNLVYLTPEEHYVCHQLLVKLHPDSAGCIWAARAMARNKYGRSNKLYGWLRRKWSEQMSVKNTTSGTKHCLVCSSSFTFFKSAEGQAAVKYCSRACYWKAKKSSDVVSYCKTCGESMTRRSWQPRVYCSAECRFKLT